jgi:hypothetical protein
MESVSCFLITTWVPVQDVVTKESIFFLFYKANCRKNSAQRLLWVPWLSTPNFRAFVYACSSPNFFDDVMGGICPAPSD